MQIWFAIIGIVAVAALFFQKARSKSEPQPEKIVRSAMRPMTDDPQIAAACLMLLMSSVGSPITNAHRALIFSLFADRFHLNEADGRMLYDTATGVILVHQQNPKLIVELAEIVRARTSVRDVIELDEMLVELSEVAGTPMPPQMRLLQAFRTVTNVTV